MRTRRNIFVILAAVLMPWIAAFESFRATPWSPLFPIQLGFAGALFFVFVPKDRRSGLLRWNLRGFLSAMGLLLLVSFVLSFIAQFVFSGLMQLPVAQWDYMAYFKQIYPDMTKKFGVTGSDLLMFLFLVVMAPVCEELFYRGVFWETFSSTSRRLMYLGSSFFFALRHDSQLTYFWPNYPIWVATFYFIITFISGLIFMRAREKTGSLLPGMVAHAGINLILLTLALLSFKSIITL